MGGELRHVLAMMGDETVTFAAFAALFLYGLVLLVMAHGGMGRFVAILILASSACWLLLVVSGWLRSGLSSWSPVAVMLLVIGIEGHAARRSDAPPSASPEATDTADVDVGLTLQAPREAGQP